MKQQVLKALANPSRIFYVPYSLAVLNFVIQFLIFIASIIICLAVINEIPTIIPMCFLISVILVHSVLAVFSKKEPQLAQVITAKLKLYKSKIPERLAS